MKKIICICLSLLIIISLVSCVKSDFSDSNKTTSIQSISQNEETNKTANKTTTQLEIETNQTSNKLIDKTETKAEIVSTAKEVINDLPPYILILSMDEIMQIKTASETLSEVEFSEYMSENFSSAEMNGMDSRQSAQNLINNLSYAHIVLIDGNYSKQKFHYYTESQDISYRVFIDESLCLRCTSYIESRNEPFFKENEYMKIDKTYETDALKIEIFKYTEEGNNEVFGNICFNDEYITFRADTGITSEDFELICQRLSVAKIGDLLNE